MRAVNKAIKNKDQSTVKDWNSKVTNQSATFVSIGFNAKLSESGCFLNKDITRQSTDGKASAV